METDEIEYDLADIRGRWFVYRWMSCLLFFLLICIKKSCKYLSFHKMTGRRIRYLPKHKVSFKGIILFKIYKET